MAQVIKGNRKLARQPHAVAKIKKCYHVPKPLAARLKRVAGVIGQSESMIVVAGIRSVVRRIEREVSAGKVVSVVLTQEEAAEDHATESEASETAPA